MNIPCKFFLQGRCKYGSRCRFRHDNYTQQVYSKKDGYYEYTDYDTYGAENARYTVDNRQKGYDTTNRYANENNQRQSRRSNSRYGDTRHDHAQSHNHNSFTEDDIFTVLRDELIDKEKAGIWPLTALGLSGDYGNVPGFEDISPEEIRHEFYISMKNGSLQEFNRKWNSSLEQVKNLINAFRMGKEEAKQIAVIIQRRTQKGGDAVITETFSSNTNQPGSTSLPQLTSGFNSYQTGSTQMSSFSFAKPSGNNFSSFPPANNVFGTSASQQPTFGTFAPQQTFAVSATPAFNTSSSQQEFATMIPQQQISVQQQLLQQSADTSNSIYSSVDEDKYQSSTFLLGNVPLNPPPKELC